MKEAYALTTSAWRTSIYSAISLLLRPVQQKPTAAQRRLARHLWWEAFALQRDMLRRPGMGAWLAALERADWIDFPTFAMSVPRDILRVVHKRRGARTAVKGPPGFAYPDYYLHDFHHQANGNLSERAARTYEWQIRLLFAGTNRLMRQCVIDAIEPGAHLRILDVGCGTAAWVPQARLQGRHHDVLGVDLSPHYLAQAKKRNDPRAGFVQLNAERLPGSWAGQYDVVVCIWLYHELPAAARNHVTQSMRRVLRPGGKLLFMDAAQAADFPEHDVRMLNDNFAHDFDEPYFADYQQLDLTRHFSSQGFVLRERRRNFVSNYLCLEKSPDDSDA